MVAEAATDLLAPSADAARVDLGEGFSLEPAPCSPLVPFGVVEFAVAATWTGSPRGDGLLLALGLDPAAFQEEGARAAAMSSLAARGLVEADDEDGASPVHATLAIAYLAERVERVIDLTLLDGEAVVAAAHVAIASEGALLLERGPLESLRAGIVDAAMPIDELLWELVDAHLAARGDAIVAFGSTRVDGSGVAVASETLAVRLAQGRPTAAGGAGRDAAQSVFARGADEGDESFEVAIRSAADVDAEPRIEEVGPDGLAHLLAALRGEGIAP